jgi:WD40 repeat protein
MVGAFWSWRWPDKDVIRVWDTSSWAELLTIEDQAYEVHLSDDDSQIVAWIFDDGTHYWDLETGSLVRTALGDKPDNVEFAENVLGDDGLSRLSGCMLSPDGSQFACIRGEHEKLIELWSVEGTRQAAFSQVFSRSIDGITFSPDGKMFATLESSHSVYMWQVKGSRVEELYHFTVDDASIDEINFVSSDSLLVYTTSPLKNGADRSIYYWQVSSETASLNWQLNDIVDGAFALSPDRAFILAVGWVEESGSDYFTIEHVDLQTGEITSTVQAPQPGPRTYVGDDAIMNGGGQWVALAGLPVQIRDVETGEELARVDDYTSEIMPGTDVIALGPDDSYIVTSNMHDFISAYVWDIPAALSDPTMADESRQTDTGSVRDIAPGSLFLEYNPDHTILITGSDHHIHLLDANQLTEITALSDHKSGVYGVAFSPDGTVLASVSFDGTIRLWGIVND